MRREGAPVLLDQSRPNVTLTDRRIPRGFRLGVGSSAWQIEGSPKAGGKGESIWDRYANENKIAGKSAPGTDYYRRYRKDIQRMRELGVDHSRFSVAWTRIDPDGTGTPNQEGIDFYKRVIDEHREAGITPWVTLYHWDLPQALENQGGWTNRRTVEAFKKYTEIVVRNLGGRVNHWLTQNEPWVSSMLGYYLGIHAPGRTSLQDGLTAAHNMMLSHGEAVPIIREYTKGDAKVGISLSLTPVYPETDREEDIKAAERFEGWYSRLYLDPLSRRGYPKDMMSIIGNYVKGPHLEADLEKIAVPTDYLGVNHYFPAVVRHGAESANRAHQLENPEENVLLNATKVDIRGLKRTTMDWPVYPRGMYDLLRWLKDDYHPQEIYITENGAAFRDEVDPNDGMVHDPERTKYYREYLEAVLQARAEDVPVNGHTFWSATDNTEWTLGNYTQRFGSVYIVPGSRQRIPKDSWYWLQDRIRTRTVDMV